MTVTNHSALYRFSFEKSSEPLNPIVLVDLMDLPQSRSEGSASVDSSTGRLTGNGTFDPSFGQGTYTLHFCVDFKGAKVRETGSWKRNSVLPDQSTISVTSGSALRADSMGTYARFHAMKANDTVLARVGVSFISVGQACRNAEKEQPDFDFAGTVSAAKKAWREKLNVISIDAGASADLQKVFWSGVYRTMISPQDYTGENPLWESDEPYYDSYYWWVKVLTRYQR